jgi:hypothetical protein
MSWASYATRALAFLGVLPLVLSKLPAEDVVVWYLFASIVALHMVADFAVRQVFTRAVSYAYAGASQLNEPAGARSLLHPNYGLLGSVFGAMSKLYVILAAVVLLLTATLGSIVVAGPISRSSDPAAGWTSWGIVVATSVMSFYGRQYLNFLEGVSEIAMARRAEAMTSLASIVSMIAAMLLSPSLSSLVLAGQFWQAAGTLRDWALCRFASRDLYRDALRLADKKENEVLGVLWPASWRAGIAGVITAATTNLTGILYAQIGTAPNAAAYFLAMKLMMQVRDISMAPFYTRLPTLNMFRARGELQRLAADAMNGMALSHFTFIGGALTVGVVAPFFIAKIGSSTPFVPSSLWYLMGLGFLLQRYGAMHLNLYMTTNHVISHVADGISGIIFLILVLALLPVLDVYAFPGAMACAFGGFYIWYARRYSYKSMRVRQFQFELHTLGPALLLLLVYGAVAALRA